MTLTYPIPMIDIFAGPGGLSEGFASLQCARKHPAFEVALSIEKDANAHATLELRAFFRHLVQHGDPTDYYRYLRGPDHDQGIDRTTLFKKHPESASYAQSRVWHKELAPQNRKTISRRIRKALVQYPAGTPWILLGGPPCQAYSVMGRSRMRSVLGDEFEKDARHRLYEEYLSILAANKPHIFVMENVKGLLSSTLQSQYVCDLILRDLKHAAGQNSYTLFSFVRHHSKPETASLVENNGYHLEAGDFLIESERYGIPQSRHRIIILGVRSDLLATAPDFSPQLLKSKTTKVPVSRVLKGLPRLRSGRSDGEDTGDTWKAVLQSAAEAPWLSQLTGEDGRLVARKIKTLVDKIRLPQADRGSRFLASDSVSIGYQPQWFLDPALAGVCNHETRSHMDSDLHRYLFASCHASVHHKTVKLGDYPAGLLPDHANVDKALQHGMFNDRFRVQLANRPATTITCHLSKDGHYAIHFDPLQCRSITVREAARIQTFPDNYFFEGTRTQQYVQVGNAVPPLLAKQLARSVLDALNTLMR